MDEEIKLEILEYWLKNPDEVGKIPKELESSVTPNEIKKLLVDIEPHPKLYGDTPPVRPSVISKHAENLREKIKKRLEIESMKLQNEIIKKQTNIQQEQLNLQKKIDEKQDKTISIQRSQNWAVWAQVSFTLILIISTVLIAYSNYNLTEKIGAQNLKLNEKLIQLNEKLIQIEESREKPKISFKKPIFEFKNDIDTFFDMLLNGKNYGNVPVYCYINITIQKDTGEIYRSNIILGDSILPNDENVFKYSSDKMSSHYTTAGPGGGNTTKTYFPTKTIKISLQPTCREIQGKSLLSEKIEKNVYECDVDLETRGYTCEGKFDINNTIGG